MLISIASRLHPSFHAYLLIGLLCIPCIVLSQNFKAPTDSMQIRLEIPQFLHEGDRIQLRGVIHNNTDRTFSGQLEFQVIDPKTNQSADGWFRNFFPNQYFSVDAKTSATTEFYIEVPYEYNHDVSFKLFAKTDAWRDSTLKTISVLRNAPPSIKSTKGSSIQRTYWRQQEAKALKQLPAGQPMRMGDTIQTRIKIKGLLAMETYILELGLPAGWDPLQNNEDRPSQHRTQPDIFIKPIKGTASGEITIYHTSVLRFSGSFIQPAILIKNKQGKIVCILQSFESLHIE